MNLYNRIQTWIAPGILALFLAALFLQSLDRLNYPYELDYGEGCSMVFLSQLKSQGTYFFDISDYPFSYATYPPLFFLLAWMVNSVVPSMLLAMRLLAFFSSCGITVLLFLIIYNRLCDKILALFFSCMFLSVWFVKPWAFLARVDMLACFLNLLGLYIFLTQIRSRRRYWAFFFWALAFFTKQNAIFPVCSVLLYALICRDQRKHFFSYFISYGIFVCAGWTVLSLYTDNESAKHLLAHTAERAFHFTAFVECFSDFIVTLLFVLLWAVPYRFFSRISETEDLILWLYFGLSLLGLISVGFTAASYNYLIEPTIALLLFSSIVSVYWIRQSSFRNQIVRYLIVLFMILVQTIWMQIYSEKNRTVLGRHFISALPLQLQEMDGQVLDNLIGKNKGDVVSENLTLLIKNNKEVFLGCSYPPAEEGLWEPQRLIHECREGRFGTIIVGQRIRAMKELFRAIEENYQYFRRIGGYDVYRSSRK